jgi:mono/diheme cytochrome c family protein
MKNLPVACLVVVLAANTPSISSPTLQDDRGRYLAVIAGCQDCHSPPDGSLFAGSIIERNGQSYYAPNLTSSSDGLGEWTDDQIRMAITTGVTPQGRQLAPVMPYLYYNSMADDDVTALILYLRQLQPVASPDRPILTHGDVSLPPVPLARSGIQLPDLNDRTATGKYLVEAVLACGACHTSVNPHGTPDWAGDLVGGQRFEGEWGVVYAGNLTPDRTTGLLPSQEEAIILAITAGRHSDRRPVYAMPWQAYSRMDGQDVQSVVDYLYSLTPITADVPRSQLNDGYEQYPDTEGVASDIVSSVTVILIILSLVGLVIYVAFQQYQRAQLARDTDWVAHFSEPLSESQIRNGPNQSDDQPSPRGD